MRSWISEAKTLYAVLASWSVHHRLDRKTCQSLKQWKCGGLTLLRYSDSWYGPHPMTSDLDGTRSELILLSPAKPRRYLWRDKIIRYRLDRSALSFPVQRWRMRGELRPSALLPLRSKLCINLLQSSTSSNQPAAFNICRSLSVKETKTEERTARHKRLKWPPPLSLLHLPLFLQGSDRRGGWGVMTLVSFRVRPQSGIHAAVAPTCCSSWSLVRNRLQVIHTMPNWVVQGPARRCSFWLLPKSAFIRHNRSITSWRWRFLASVLVSSNMKSEAAVFSSWEAHSQMRSMTTVASTAAQRLLTHWDPCFCCVFLPPPRLFLASCGVAWHRWQQKSHLI